MSEPARSVPTLPAETVAAWRTALLAWFAAQGRDLPWRRTRDPWAVLVSETMLQQTPVSRVVGRWEPFVARWPDPASCAAAPRAAVIAAWAGLGYNRRAVRLHEAAGAMVGRHGGRVPADLPALLALPGVGPYTARAVLAFAFGRPVGVVDTNVARVLARAGAGRRLRAPEAQALADQLTPPGAAWCWNQAMLDLGAACCVARTPDCLSCPVGRAGACTWSGAGRHVPDPAAGTAGVPGRQPPFAGSDREGRGRLVAALRGGPVAPADLAAVAGWPDDPARATAAAAGLVADGLAVTLPGGGLSLPL